MSGEVSNGIQCSVTRLKSFRLPICNYHNILMGEQRGFKWDSVFSDLFEIIPLTHL